MCQAPSTVLWHRVRCSKYNSFYCYCYYLIVLALYKKAPPWKGIEWGEGNLPTMMTQPFYARALLGSEESLMETQRLRIQEVFQADSVGSLPTEETGSRVVYAGISVPDSTVFTHSWLLTTLASHLPKDLLSLTLFRLHAGWNNTGGCSTPSLGWWRPPEIHQPAQTSELSGVMAESLVFWMRTSVCPQCRQRLSVWVEGCDKYFWICLENSEKGLGPMSWVGKKKLGFWALLRAPLGFALVPVYCGTQGSKFRFLLDGGKVSALSQPHSQGQVLDCIAQYRSERGWRPQRVPTGQNICQDQGGLGLWLRKTDVGTGRRSSGDNICSTSLVIRETYMKPWDATT